MKIIIPAYYVLHENRMNQWPILRRLYDRAFIASTTGVTRQFLSLYNGNPWQINLCLAIVQVDGRGLHLCAMLLTPEACVNYS